MRRAPLAPLGAGDPVVAAFLARVCALTPAEWERLGRAGVGRAGPARPPGAVGRWLGPGLARLSEALDDWSHGVNRRQYAPDAAWAGGAAAGPFGALGAALDAAAARPEVGRLARIRVMSGLAAVQYRRVLPPATVRRSYRWVDLVIPWTSLPGAEPQAPQDPAG